MRSLDYSRLLFFICLVMVIIMWYNIKVVKEMFKNDKTKGIALVKSDVIEDLSDKIFPKETNNNG